jgi:hypothetical protein
MKTTQIFKQKKATLCNGEVVRFGDMVGFMGSDGYEIKGNIGRKTDGTLYFHNNRYDLKDYPALHKIS